MTFNPFRNKPLFSAASLLLAAVVCAAVLLSAGKASAASVMLGDADGSGTVNINDVTCIQTKVAEVDGTTYYAHWGYRPKFETNGGNYTDFPDYAIQDTASYTIETLPTVTKENCTFKGWYLEGEPDTNPLSNGATVDLSSGKIIEARWTPNTYIEVTLDANTGSLGNAVNPIKVYKNTKIGALPVPTKDGYDFMGWYTDTQGEGTKYTADSTVGEQPVTLHAVWAERKYTVTFTAIGNNAFLNDENLTLGVYYGSFAQTYAEENGIPYVIIGGVKLGDVNGDKVVNINDVTAIQSHLAEMNKLEGIFLKAADVNQNGDVKNDDATALQMYLAEYEVPYPVDEEMPKS